MATCNSCGAPMAWAVTTGGRLIPLDAHLGGEVDGTPLAVDDGNLALTGRTLASRRGAVPEIEVRAPALFDDEPRYRSHFSTCPQAAQHRRPRP